MKVLILTNEYPPHIYGGAGVHVDYLSRALAKLCQVDVRCFGDQRELLESLSVTGFSVHPPRYTAPEPLWGVFSALQRCLDFTTTGDGADLVHAHTWYTCLGGILNKLSYTIPFVLTTHSLEPLRPWKREQLGGGYDVSCWVERAAVEAANALVAVSEDTRRDILRIYRPAPEKVHVIHNGIDLDEYRPTADPDRVRPLGIDPAKPYVLCVGRLTRQKGLIHFARAIRNLPADVQAVLYATAPDTKEIEAEIEAEIAARQQERPGVVWIRTVLDLPTKVALYSHAEVFCCPSVYEPFGITNLEAMACEVPVVASAVGGIREVVVDGETGVLVPLETNPESPFEPVDPDRFESDIANGIKDAMRSPSRRTKMGKAGRRRAVEHFSWAATAKKTYALYQSILSR
ncbi:MAG TPA: glycogen synthase [bacterium]